MNLDPVRRVLDSIGAPYALIGAHALAARGYPRFTVDVDLLTTDARVLDRSTWAPLDAIRASVEPRRGDRDDPLGGVVHILLPDGTDIDIVLAKWKWEAGIIERAEVMSVMPGVLMAVPRSSDLILLKLAAGGPLDIRDAVELLAAGDRDAVVPEVEARIGEVYPDVRAAWREVLAAGG
jgi:hypothetical protein